MYWAMAHMASVERPTHRLVLLYLGWRASSALDTWGEVWPSQDDVLDVTGVDRKTLRAALKTFQEGLLPLVEDTGRRTGKTKQIVVYRLIGVPTMEEVREISMDAIRSHRRGPETEGSENGPVRASKGCRSGPERGPKTDHGKDRETHGCADAGARAHEDLAVGGGPAVEFDDWYGAYPKRQKRADAEKAWRKLGPDDQRAAWRDVVELERGKRDPDWIRDGGQYVPNPATYLNGRRWQDEWTPREVTDGRTEAHQRGARGAGVQRPVDAGIEHHRRVLEERFGRGSS